MKILISGVYGFIGMSLAKALLDQGHNVVGFDNYKTNILGTRSLALARSKQLLSHPNFEYHDCELESWGELTQIFSWHKFDIVYNLAALAGVNNSTYYPYHYTKSNIEGFGNILELCKHNKVPHLVFASSSSVYGHTDKACAETAPTDSPLSYYAATKKANEVMAASYANTHGMKITGIRLFTVFGPWGRPDMATWKFTDSIINNEPITLYNDREMIRDFTFIDDVVEQLIKVGINDSPKRNAEQFQIYNIGSNRPVKVSEYVSMLEQIIGKKAIRQYKKSPACEVTLTYADTNKLQDHFGTFRPTDIEIGLEKFVTWFKRTII